MQNLTYKQIENAFNDFQKEHNYNIPVKLNIEERYHYDSTQEAIANRTVTYGSYEQSKHQITLYQAALSSNEQIIATIRHELIGHYGIDTFTPVEKRTLLDRIIASRDEPSLREQWGSVERDYPKPTNERVDVHKYRQAEEVYALVAEFDPKVIARLDPKLVITRTTDNEPTILDKRTVLTGQELRTITEAVDNGIIAGFRQTQTIRETDYSTFSKDMKQEPSMENITVEEAIKREKEQRENEVRVEHTSFTNEQKEAIFDYAYANLAVNLDALYADKRYRDKADAEIADIAFYRGVMAKSSEIQGLPADYNLYDTKAFLFGVPIVVGLENNPVVIEAQEKNKSRDKDDGNSL